MIFECQFVILTGHLAGRLGSAFSKVDALLPRGILLGSLTVEQPRAKVQDIFRD